MCDETSDQTFSKNAIRPNIKVNMDVGPFIVLNGYPGVGKSSVALALQALIPGSKVLQNHLLIEPVAALLEREDTGYRDLRKALRTPILDSIATNPSLRQRTIITTYYQETLEDREIDLKEYFESAVKGGRPFLVFILRCSPEENTRRLLDRSSSLKSRLTDAKILEEIRRHHFIYSFFDDGFMKPDVWEYQLDIEDTTPEEAARKILELMKDVPGLITDETDNESVALKTRDYLQPARFPLEYLYLPPW